MPRKSQSLPSHLTSEKSIEHYFCSEMRKLQLPCIKQFNPYEAGWPDRLVVLPPASVLWVEFKSTGKRPTALQRHRHETLRALGHEVHVISTRAEAEDLVRIITQNLQIDLSI